MKVEQLSEYVINELKLLGVNHHKKKRKNVDQVNVFIIIFFSLFKNFFLKNWKCRQSIFRTPMCLLEQTDVVLANGRVVQIPTFVADACSRILEQVETEGLFRKAGSFSRQKEICVSSKTLI